MCVVSAITAFSIKATETRRSVTTLCGMMAASVLTDKKNIMTQVKMCMTGVMFQSFIHVFFPSHVRRLPPSLGCLTGNLTLTKMDFSGFKHPLNHLGYWKYTTYSNI